MAVRDLVPALQAAVEGFNTVVDGKQPTLDAKLPTAQTARDGVRVSRDGALVARDATILSRDAAYRDFRSAKANLDHQDLAALAASKAVNAVDVFIYDTSKDSDGGAWRKRCAKTSWFNETLNTATRGARREFPAVAVLVLEAGKLTIYDGDDPALPMWMVFNTGLGSVVAYGNDVRSVVAVNAQIVVGSADTGGLSLFSMLETPYRLIQQNGHYVLPSRGLIANRNAGIPWTPMVNAEPRLVDTRVLDVAVTVLADARRDPGTGLPTPTIAAATEGGVSVINNDGAVVDLPGNSPGCNTVVFDKDRLLVGDAFATRIFSGPLPEVNDTLTNWRTAQFARTELGGTDVFITPRAIDRFDKITATALAASNGERLIHLLDHPANAEKSAVAFTASDFATGWLPGDIRGAFLAETDATDFVGGTDADRSVHNNPLTVNGTITRASVATGADLVAYSGFSDSNFLEQPYNSGLDFGTGDFCVLGWVYSTDATYRGLVGIEHLYPDANGDTGWVLFTSGSADVRFRRLTDGAIADVGVAYAWPSGWSFFCVARIGTTMRLWTNGSYIGENSHSTLAFDVSGSPERTLKIGRTSNYGGKRAALFRISATVPHNDQIHRIYQDEKALFQENAACTLYGASDAVTALAHDPDTGLLHVGTSAGRSVFKGLRRVDNTTQPVTTAISAANGMVIEQ